MCKYIAVSTNKININVMLLLNEREYTDACLHLKIHSINFLSTKKQTRQFSSANFQKSLVQAISYREFKD